jgi:CheY-like chemotaxis protein
MVNLEQGAILLVEDDPGHARLIIKSFEREAVTNPIMRIGDGQEALD